MYPYISKNFLEFQKILIKYFLNINIINLLYKNNPFKKSLIAVLVLF